MTEILDIIENQNTSKGFSTLSLVIRVFNAIMIGYFSMMFSLLQSQE